MKRSNFSSILMILSVFIFVALAACAATEETQPPEPEPVEQVEAEEPQTAEEEAAPPAPELFGDPLRGGLLYDKWWTPLGLDAPEGDQPLWATQDSNTRSGGDTWRCKECHGWDYKGAEGAYASGSHFTGFIGVIQWAGGDANEILAALKGATNPDHDFSTVMDDQALVDIALFLSEEVVDYAAAVGDDKGALSSDFATGETLYQETCAECHGPEGLAINFDANVASPEYLAGLANGNPWEFLHKIRFGQPGTEMPSVIDAGWTFEEQAAVLAYSQSLPNESLVSQGGLLYDKWWNALGLDEPSEDNPLWATQDTNTRSGADTWRCKECHGWDYQGADGAYSSGSHFTGFTGVLGAAGMTTEELSAWMDGTTNPDHDFSAFFDESSTDMIVAFVQDGIVDMTIYINEDKTVNGDPTIGMGLFESTCTRCHGEDGQNINFGDDEEPEFLGDLANGNPWETLHKAAFGQPATKMPSGLNLGWSWQELVDLLAYLQTLPGAE